MPFPLKTIFDGCLGGITMGIYSSYITDKHIREHNLKIEQQIELKSREVDEKYKNINPK
jgi:hypothetical protein